jgi:hypothetical protein
VNSAAFSAPIAGRQEFRVWAAVGL